MPDRYTQVVVLCEDLVQGNFVRRYLMHRGVPHGRIHLKHCPPGSQAGEQHVRQQYATEVRAIRTAPVIAGLVTVVDADRASVRERENQLATALTNAGQPPRGTDERLGVLIPKRNVETWIWYLGGHAVNEHDDYGHDVRPRDRAPAAAEFAKRCPHRMHADSPHHSNRAVANSTASGSSSSRNEAAAPAGERAED